MKMSKKQKEKSMESEKKKNHEELPCSVSRAYAKDENMKRSRRKMKGDKEEKGKIRIPPKLNYKTRK